MVQASHDWELDYLAHFGRLDRSRIGRILAERKVSATPVIVLANESSKQSPQMKLVHHDDVIDQFSPQGADHAFDVRPLPRGPSGNDDFFDAQVLDAIPKDRATNAVTVP